MNGRRRLYDNSRGHEQWRKRDGPRIRRSGQGYPRPDKSLRSRTIFFVIDLSGGGRRPSLWNRTRGCERRGGVAPHLYMYPIPRRLPFTIIKRYGFAEKDRKEVKWCGYLEAAVLSTVGFDLRVVTPLRTRLMIAQTVVVSGKHLASTVRRSDPTTYVTSLLSLFIN